MMGTDDEKSLVAISMLFNVIITNLHDDRAHVCVCVCVDDDDDDDASVQAPHFHLCAAELSCEIKKSIAVVTGYFTSCSQS